MRKFILTMIIAFMMVFSANAQIATENRKALDNIYAGVEIGATTPLNFNSVFPVNAAAGLKIGKEFTPVYALEAEGMVFFNDNNFTRWTNTFVKGTNVGANLAINLSNLLWGYPGKPRAVELKTNTGLGWLHCWETSNNALSAKTAVDIVFNIGSKRAHSLVVSPGVYWNLTETGKVQFNKSFAQLGVFASYVYHFKTSNGTHYFKTYDVGAMMDEISRLNEELAKKPTTVVERVEVPVLSEPVIVDKTATYVFFAYDSDELDERAQSELNKLGENGIYRIDAFASSEGSTDYNKALSQRRADAVKDYLEARGCRVEIAVGHGVVFGPTTGRVAVVSVK